MPDPTCTQCGQPLPADGRFCSRCGAVFVRVSHASHASHDGALPQTPGPGNGTLDVGGSAAAPPQAAQPEKAPVPGATLYDARVAPQVAAAAPVTSQATMFGFAPSAELSAKLAGVPLSVASEPGPPAAAPAPSVAAQARHKHTMIGVSRTPLNDVDGLPVRPGSNRPPPMSTPPPAMLPSAQGTMMGVALPGIAPLQTGAPSPTGFVGGKGSTMLGVALPGIAPIHAATSGGATAPRGAAASAPVAPKMNARTMPLIVPAPAPLVDDEPALGPAPRRNRNGIPVAYAAGGVFALVLVVGLVVALLWKGQSLVVVPRLDAQGRDQLHLTCDSCQDGTTATLAGGAAPTATFAAKEADLTLAAPLEVGDNALTIRLDRPRWGRDEDVSVVVPVAFRIKPDLSGLAGAKPAVVVRVTAVPGAVVQVDGKPVTLDAKGVGSYPIDMSAQTTGWSDDLRLIDQTIPYSIVTAPTGDRKGGEQHGTLAARAGIVTLHLDSPGLESVIDRPTVRLVGHTLKGATLLANGQPVPVEPDGSFSKSLDVPLLGDTTIELRADGAPQSSLGSRTARFTIKRVAKLEGEAKARERAPWIAYDAMMADPTGSVGKPSIVEGEVVSARAASGQVIAVIDDTRGCRAPGTGACLVRVVYPGEDTVTLTRGARAKVFGKVTGAVPPSGAQTTPVPIVQADFVVKGARH